MNWAGLRGPAAILVKSQGFEIDQSRIGGGAAWKTLSSA
jgi:hypothetical protein